MAHRQIAPARPLSISVNVARAALEPSGESAPRTLLPPAGTLKLQLHPKGQHLLDGMLPKNVDIHASSCEIL